MIAAATFDDLFSIEGKVALVTGGSRGIGAAIAEGLAEAGASLMLLARREQWLAPTVDAMKQRGFTIPESTYGSACANASAAAGLSP